jgi:transposase InsO family protein/transposase-like protein
MSRRSYTAAQKQTAVDLYREGGKSLRAVSKELGYPAKSCLHRWLAEDPGDWPRKASPTRTRYPVAVKLEAVGRLRAGEPAGDVAMRYDISSPDLVRSWARRADEGGHMALGREDGGPAAPPGPPDDVEGLRARVHDLELENALMRGVVEILKKDPGIDQGGLSNPEKATLIDALRASFTLRELLARLRMAESSYYYSRRALSRPDKHARLRGEVRAVFEASEGRYGSVRVWLALRARGIRASEKVVRRIMREEGLEAAYPRKRRRYSSYAGEASAAPENLIARDFHAGAPCEKWLTDITEMKAADAKVYLSPVIDCFDGKVVSYTLGLHPDAELANTMLTQAIATLPAGRRPILHSDRGIHYRLPGWIAIAEGAGLTRSMSAKGCSPDNAACEGFFGRLKNEMYHGFGWARRRASELIEALRGYIEWYNEGRIKASLGGMSPNQYRRSLGLAL